MPQQSQRSRDWIKILITLGLAGFMVLLSYIFSLGPLEAIRGGVVIGPNPKAVRVIQWICILPAIGFGLFSGKLLLTVWRQLITPRERVKQSPATISKVVEDVATHHSTLATLDLSRVTGAAWVLGLSSVLIPTIILAGMIQGEGANYRKSKAIGYLVYASGVVIFGIGYWVLRRMGVPLLEVEYKEEDSDDEADSPSPQGGSY